MIRSTILVVLFLLSSTHDTEAQDRRVWIVNDTSWTMTHFYASNVDRTVWEEDILGRDILYPGERVRVDIDDGTGYCLYDLKAVFEDGDEVVRSGFDVCDSGSWTVYD